MKKQKLLFFRLLQAFLHYEGTRFLCHKQCQVTAIIDRVKTVKVYNKKLVYLIVSV